jgi:hypothetical protein
MLILAPQDARAERDNAGLRSAHDSQLKVSEFKRKNRQMGYEPKALMIGDLPGRSKEQGLTACGAPVGGRVLAVCSRHPGLNGEIWRIGDKAPEHIGIYRSRICLSR